jgi:hypothetical protein
MQMFTFIDAKRFFSAKEVFQIKTSVKGMTPESVFTFLSMKADETGNEAYAQLAATMVVKTYIN